MKGLYIHIPFCEHICHYCDFVKRVPKDEAMMDTYIDHLIAEISSYKAHFDSIQTIYIGGGTPSMLSVSNLHKLLESLKDIDPIEFTIEVNPESYDEEKGVLFKSYGINRFSLGVQTFNQTLLEDLNRKHTNDQVYRTVQHLKQIGIPSISVDLIYAIPNQTIADLKEDLDNIQKLDVQHVSCYSLILEEKTVFYDRYLKGLFKPTDQDLEASMYETIMKTLKGIGFEHYEISNYAKKGHQSKHNLIYWSMGEYIGCGLGAHGMIDGYRTINQRWLSDYYRAPLKEKTFQTPKDELQDTMIFGLRKIEGVSIKHIDSTFDIDLFQTFPGIKETIDQGLLTIEKGNLKLTERGLFLGNQVFMVFV